MRVTCSKCKKIYTVDSSKIPPNISSTRCKACGNAISLQPPAQRKKASGASQKPPKAPSGSIQITCQYCSQQFKIKTRAIPEGVTSTRCKACGHKIFLKPGVTAAMPAIKAETAGGQNKGILNIACLYCGKKYSINAAKIPPGVKTTKCKACGRPMSLVAPPPGVATLKTDGEKPAFNKQPQTIQKFPDHDPDGPVIADTGQRVNPVWQKRRPLIALAAVLVLALVGYFAMTQWSRLGDSGLGLGTISAKKPAVQKPAPDAKTKVFTASQIAAEPFFAARINVPLLLAAVDQNTAEDKKNIQYKMTTTIIKSLGLTDVELYFFSHPQHTVLPVIFASGEDGSSLKTLLTSQINYVQVLESHTDGFYRIKKDAIPADRQDSFPIDLYRVEFSDNRAIFAPADLIKRFARKPETLHKTRVAQMIAAIAQPRDLAALSIRIPENLDADWQKKIQSNPAVKQSPQAAMMIAMGGGMVNQLSESLKGVDSLAIGFRLDETNGRMLSYAQQFREGVDGKGIYRQLKAQNTDDLDADGTVLRLIELFSDPRYKHTLAHKNNRLMIGLNWEQTHDEAILSALSEATIGQMLAQGMELTPSEGPVAAQYVDTPRIVPVVNVESLKNTIPAAVAQNLFPGNYWSFGDEPRMTLDFDTLAIPNASLAQLKYEISEVLSVDGVDIRRVEEKAFQHIINPGSASPGFIEINVKKNTPAESLGTAKIQFNIALPFRLKIFEFVSPNDSPGAVRKSDGVSVKLRRLEKDVAKITFRGGTSAKLFAFDSTGRSLASRESMSTASSAASRFQGEIYRLQVVVVEEIFEHTFEVVADLNRGKELVLSHKPETPTRLRYDHRPMQSFASYTENELNGLHVEWKEAGGMMWTDSLQVNLPRGPFSGDIRWEVHFFGERKPFFLSGNAFHGPAGFSYGLSNGELKKAHAAFGIVKMELASAIERFTFKKQADGKSSHQKLPSGQPIKVVFNQNEITIDAGNADVIQSMAFDAQGLQLRKDGYTGINGSRKKMYFWGVPARFVIDVATAKIHKTIDFDVRQRTVDETRYSKFKQDITNHRDVVRTLKQIAGARRKDRTKYGDDIAGLFYLYGRKQKKPMALIDKKVAHSDPAGQKRFGYTLKPYKGYYFTVLSGVESGGKQNNYMRLPKQRSYTWQKGSFKTTPFLQPPDLVAIPKDGTQPTFFMQFNQIFMKQLNGDKLTYLPEDYYSTGWVEAKFVEG
ncbi:MAG: zinc-ribbon domain-containing protein [Desulfobacterales bacterium]|jgi:predicted Zn finger-like uncharacterized protein